MVVMFDTKVLDYTQVLNSRTDLSLNKDKDNNSSSSINLPTKQVSEKSKPLIIIGFIISLSSIFLLLYTINYKFG